MKAIGFQTSLPIDDPRSLFAFDKALPVPGPQDLRVKISAVSVNPADAKVRVRAAAGRQLEHPRILGYDAVGVVDAVGAEVTGFAVGDRVFYAGDITRDGSNAEYQLVDARIAAVAPARLGDADAAVLPLTALTAYEAIFDRLRIDPQARGQTLLVIGGAGGVGSIATQIAKHCTGLTVIATASRPETQAWSRRMGADHVADHRNLVASVQALGFQTVDYIFNTADTVGHWHAMAELIAPQGTIASIVEFNGGVDLSKLQGKSAGFVWELMFTRPMHKTRDIARQGDILRRIAEMADAGTLQSTRTQTIAGFSVESLQEAHRRIERGDTIGKIAVTY